MSDQYFDYDLMVQEALKGVVSDILDTVAHEGLKGDHHYYIAFRTTHPDVVIPEHIAARYPDEMTIVIQHRYWGLKVNEESFEIGLSFNQKPELLVIPFDAIIGFVDPSAQFALQFEYGEDKASNDTGLEIDHNSEKGATETISIAPKKESIKAKPASQPKKVAPVEKAVKKDENNKVVALDAFRKK